MGFLRALLGADKPDVAALRAARDVEGLIAALKYKKDPKVRLAAAEALGDLGDLRAKIPLHTALEDDDFDVRAAVQTALGKLVKER